MSKKTRSRNFTREEKALVCEIASNYTNIIENKLTDAGSNKQRADTWNIITAIYNARQISGVRNGVQLKALYDFLKRKARKDGDQVLEVQKPIGSEFIGAVNALNEKDIFTLSPPQLPPILSAFNYDTSDQDDLSINSEPLTEVKVEPVSEEDSIISPKFEIDPLPPLTPNNFSNLITKAKSTESVNSVVATSSSHITREAVKRTIGINQEGEDSVTVNKRLNGIKNDEDCAVTINKIKIECAELELQLKKEEFGILQRRAVTEDAEAKIRYETLLLEKQAAQMNLEIKKIQLEKLKRSQ